MDSEKMLDLFPSPSWTTPAVPATRASRSVVAKQGCFPMPEREWLGGVAQNGRGPVPSDNDSDNGRRYSSKMTRQTTANVMKALGQRMRNHVKDVMLGEINSAVQESSQ
jgi:hypothetical protein